MEELQAVREDVSGVRSEVHEVKLEMQAMGARLEARFLRTVLMVNVPSILGAVGLAFAATRVG